MQKPQFCRQEAPGETIASFSKGLITGPQIEQLMNLTVVAAAVVLAVWEIRASKQQIGRTLTSVKQGQITNAWEGGKVTLLSPSIHCGFRTTQSRFWAGSGSGQLGVHQLGVRQFRTVLQDGSAAP